MPGDERERAVEEVVELAGVGEEENCGVRRRLGDDSRLLARICELGKARKMSRKPPTSARSTTARDGGELDHLPAAMVETGKARGIEGGGGEENWGEERVARVPGRFSARAYKGARLRLPAGLHASPWQRADVRWR